MAEPAIPVDNPNRELPQPGTVAELPSARPGPATNHRLNETAEAIGNAVGSAVETVRHLPERLQDMKERFTVIRGRAQEDAATRAAELKETAQQKAQQARTRAAHLAREYPLQVIAGVAGGAFILGFVLRIWRSKHA